MEKLQNLYLITDGFPFGKGEKPFILPELPYLLKEYKVTIISPAPVEVAQDTRYVTKLDERIQLVHIPPPILKLSNSTINYFVQNPIFKEEANFIVGEGQLVQERINDALSALINAEIFFQQVFNSHAVNFNEPCLIYTFWNHFRTLAFCLHKNEYPNMKIVTRAHRYDLYNESQFHSRQPFKSFMNKLVDGIFFVAEKGLDYYSKTFTRNLQLEKLHYSPLGISQTETIPLQNRLNRFHLVSCSNVIPLKRVELIAKALAVCDTHCKIHWTHFGDGESMPEVKRLAENLLKPRGNITYWFKGHCSNEEVIRYYSFMHCSCFITTSSSEGSPVSIQEALSFGIPIIGTNVGGINEEIDGNGILLSANPSAEEVANAIMRIYGMSDKQVKKYRKRSRKIWEEKYNIEKNARRFLDILRTI